MLTFCSVSGLPTVQGLFSPAAWMGGSQPGEMPDLLEEQEALFPWFSDDGERVIFRVQCVFVQTEQNAPFPSLSRVMYAGREISLVFPCVIHNTARQQVILYLPESYRQRAYTVLSWWMMCLQLSPREQIPDYATQPKLVFFTLAQRASTPSAEIDLQTKREVRLLQRVVEPALPSSDTQTKTSRSDIDTIRDAPSPRTSRHLGDGNPNVFVKPEPPESGNHASSRATRPPESVASSLFADPKSLAENLRPSGQKSMRVEELHNLASNPQDVELVSLMPVAEPSDPAATREAPAPVVPVDETNIMLGSDPAANNRLDKIVVERGSRAPDVYVPEIQEEVPTPIHIDEVATKVSRRPPSLASRSQESSSPLVEPWKQVPGLEPLEGDISSSPTVSRRTDTGSLAEIRSGSGPRDITAIRQIIGNGISISPEYQTFHFPPVRMENWQQSRQPWFFEVDLEAQRCLLSFLFPKTSARILDQGGQINCYLQLHRLPTYPLLVLLFTFHDAEDGLRDYTFCPFDIEDPQALMFMDMLMQNFSLRVFLCNEKYQTYRDLQVQLALEPNVEYLLQQARHARMSIEPGLRNISQAISLYRRGEFDRLGQMSHNFSQDSFSDIASAAKARLASGIIAYWSEPEQYDYLIAIKSFPMDYFRSIQRRVIEACIHYGIFMPMHLLKIAVEWNLGHSIPELLRRMLANFAEVNLNLRQNNDLDAWDTFENWQQLFDISDQFEISIDPSIEEMAIKAQKHFEAHAEQKNQTEGEVFEEIEAFQNMDPRDLLDMLQEPANRYEAALALCDLANPAYVDHAAAVFSDITNREDAISFADAFTQFGQEAEPLLVSWLHLPQKYHREAAMLALGTMQSAHAMDAILKRLRSGEEWEAAAEALGRMGDLAIPALGQELQNKNWLIRLRAIKALHKINTAQARNLIEPLLQDPNEVVKAEAAAVLLL